MKDSGWLKNKNLCVEGPTDLKTEGGPAILKPCDKIENQVNYFLKSFKI